MTPYYDILQTPRLSHDTDFATFDKWTNKNICLTFNKIYTTLTPTKRKSLSTFHKALAHWWSTSYTTKPIHDMLYLGRPH